MLLKIVLLGNYVVVNIWYVCKHVWYVCRGQLSNPEKQYYLFCLRLAQLLLPLAYRARFGERALLDTHCCACSVTPGFLGLWKLADTTLQYHSVHHRIIICCTCTIEDGSASEESGNEAKLVLMVFRCVDA